MLQTSSVIQQKHHTLQQAYVTVQQTGNSPLQVSRILL
ncbi:hypothetical protein FLA_3367 [Filimonas lacunae]|nr:hypothetical protein FLA_3367 [Filimonas lacunae]